MLWGKPLADLEGAHTSLSPQLPLLWLLVKGRLHIGERQGVQGYILCGCVVAGKLMLALYGKSYGGPHAWGARYVQKGGDPGCKRGVGEHHSSWCRNLDVLCHQSPAWDQAGQIKPAGASGCRFLGAAAGWVAEPGVAELAWVGREVSVRSVVHPILTPGVCARGVCPDSSCSVLAELGSFPPLLSRLPPLVYVRVPFLRLSEISFPLCGQETDFNCLYFLPLFFLYFVLSPLPLPSRIPSFPAPLVCPSLPPSFPSPPSLSPSLSRLFFSLSIANNVSGIISRPRPALLQEPCLYFQVSGGRRWLLVGMVALGELPVALPK